MVRYSRSGKRKKHTTHCTIGYRRIGAPHKEGLNQADKQQVYNCIKDRTGMFLLQDENVLYVETEEEFEKPKFGTHR